MENRGPVAFVLVLAAAAVTLTGLRQADPGSVASKREAATGPAAARSQAASGSLAARPPLASCESTPEPLRPLCDQFHSSAAPAPGSTVPLWVEQVRGRLRFLVVLAGDPALTGDRLRIDRTIESIQNAAAATGYQFDRFWLPWSSAPRSDGTRDDDTGPVVEPGLLLFRPAVQPGDYLAVFLVGESPVQGVNLAAFRKAIRYISELSNAGRLQRIDVAGPNFSGSFPSLGRVIDETAGVVDSFRVISPSATGVPPRRFQDKTTDNRAPPVVYRSVVHSDRFARARLDSYLEDHWSSARQAMVTLSESNTAFGTPRGPQGTDRPQTLTVQFPRQIARLRSASPDVTPTGPSVPGGDGRTTDGRLPVPLKDLQGGSDSVPTFAAQQRPVAQEAMLLEIVSLIRQEHTAFVQIVATDTLDAIFLSSFLRRAYPDARMVVPNADMLFVRAADRLPLSGTLSLTTFPLFLRSQLWMLQPGGGLPRRMWPMGSRFEVGLFNSCRALLLEQQKGADQSPGDNRPLEFGGAARPPLWLTVVGNNGYWPIALLDVGDDHQSDPWQLTWPAPAKGQAGVPFDVGRPTQLWEAVFWLLTMAGILIPAFLLWAFLASAKAGGQSGRASRVLPPRMRWPGAPYALVAGCLALAATIFAMSSPVWWLVSRSHAPGWGRAAAIASGLAFAATAGAGFILFVVVLAKRPWKASGGDYSLGYAVLSAAAVCVFGIFVTAWYSMLGRGQHRETLFLSYRSLDLLNGVSPVLPFLLLGAAFVVFALLHGLRQTIFLEMAPGLPGLNHGGAAQSVKSRVEAVRDAMGHPLLAARPAAWTLFALGMSTLLFLWPIFFAPPQSLEDRLYDYTYGGALLLLYGFVLLSWARFLFAWHNLNAVLDALERHPVRLALNELPHGYSALPILQGTGKYSFPTLQRRSLEILRLLVNRTPSGDPCVPLDSLKTHEELKNSLESLESSVSAYDVLGTSADATLLRRVQTALGAVGDQIAGELNDFWAKGSPAALERRGAATPAPGSETVTLGREFVAVQYVMFACNAMRQLRNILLYLTTGFFLGVVSSLVYPFRSQEQLAWAATINFVILGLPVILAIVQMERDDTLARLTDPGTKRGTAAVLVRLAAYGLLPLLGLLTSHVPGIGRFLISVLEPAIGALP